MGNFYFICVYLSVPAMDYDCCPINELCFHYNVIIVFMPAWLCVLLSSLILFVYLFFSSLISFSEFGCI